MTNGTVPNLYDRRAERAYAAGLAEQQRATADALRADTMLRLRQAERDQARAEAADREQARRTRSYHRAARLRSLRESAVRFAPAVAGGVAMGAPIVLAWSGQLAFGTEVMELGPLAPIVPVALEGAVWYVAYLTHRATQLGLPTGAYRAWAWILAGIAASMNFWHGTTSTGGAQRGAVLALASLLGVGLWELTVRLRTRTGRARTPVEHRTVLARRARYPRLSFTAWSIRIARTGCTREEAWAAAWERRYGVAPGEVRTDPVQEAPVQVEPAPVRRAYVFRTVPRTQEPRTVRVARAFTFRTGPKVEAVRTVRRTFAFQTDRTVEQPAPRTENAPVPADKDVFVAAIRTEILAAADRNDWWGPDYAALIARTGRSRSWVEKRVREARTGLIPATSTTA